MRTKNSILNFLTDAIPQLVIAILGLFKAKFFLSYLGENTLGLYQTFGQFLAYLAVLEAGVAIASLYKLYKPVSEKNTSRVKEILAGNRKIFRVVGVLFFGIGTVIAFGIPFMIKGNEFPYFYIVFTFILYICTNLMNFFTITDKLVFEAHQKKYVTNFTLQMCLVVKSILEIACLLLGFSFIAILLVGIAMNIVSNLICKYQAKKHFDMNLRTVTPDTSMLKDIKQLVVFRICDIITFNVDIVLITAMLGLKSSVIYTAYNYIVENVRVLIDKVSASIQASVGNLVVMQAHKSESVFYEFTRFTFFLATMVAIPLNFVISPFIGIWYNHEIFTSNILAFLFCFQLFYMIIRIPMNVYVNAYGLFKETKWIPIVCAIANLGCSILLIQIWGIPGVLVGTLLSLLLVEFIFKPLILNKKVFQKKRLLYFKECGILFLVAIFLYLTIGFLSRFFNMSNFVWWLISSVILFGINALLLLFFYLGMRKFQFGERIISLFLKGRGTMIKDALHYYQENGLKALLVKLKNRKRARQNGEYNLKYDFEANIPFSTAKPNIYIFCGLPYYDNGGGQRCSQLAKTFTGMGYLVGYLYTYGANEKSDGKIEIPSNLHMRLDHFSLSLFHPKEQDIILIEAPIPGFLPYLESAKKAGSHLIYENIDNWETVLGKNFFHPTTLKNILELSDIWVGTAKPLLRQLKEYQENFAIAEKPVVYLPNACNDELFDRHQKYICPNDLVKGEKTLLYYGAFNPEWYDWDLLKEVAKVDGISINFIGNDQNIGVLKETFPTNFHFLGLKKQAELPAYLAYSDYTILPFKVEEVGEYVSPLKIFEYIAMGTYVLATPLPEILMYPNVMTATEPDKWKETILRCPSVDLEASDTFLKQNSWSSRAQTLFDLTQNRNR